MASPLALVTGANGFIGRHLCERLLREGFRVRALVLPGEDTTFLERAGTEILQGNLLDPDSLKGLGQGCSHVFHLAARVVDWGSRRQFYSVIYDGTRNLLHALAGGKPRFVFASSIAAMGLGRELNFPNEETPAQKTGIYYGDAKLDAEILIKNFAKEQSLPFTIIRPTNVTGPGSVWAQLPLQKMGELTGLPLIDGGRHPACLVDIHNLVDGIFKASTLEQGVGQTYFFMDDWEVSWKQYFSDLGKLQGKRPGPALPYPVVWHLSAGLEGLFSPWGLRLPVSRLGAALTGRDNRVDTRKAREELGWRSARTYEACLEDIRRWLEQN